MMRTSLTRTIRAARSLLGAALVLNVAAGGAWAQGDAALGAKLFLQCRACHSVEKGAPAGVGPPLWGVMGAQAGQRPGYSYSSALAASRIVWSPVTMDAWLTQPTAVVPGTRMAFQGVASPKARAALIAYLLTLDARPSSKTATAAVRHPSS